MYFLAIGIGAFVGITIFNLRSEWLAGCFAGGAIGFLVAKLLIMEKKILALQQRSIGQPIPEPAKAAPPAITETEDFSPELNFDIEADIPPTPAHIAPSTPPKDKSNSIDLWQIVVSYFTGGNVVVRAGIIVLFFGVAFLFKYTAERNIVPIEFRLLGVCLGALALLIVGWRLRVSRTTYALIMQGGGIGVLYLTIFAALRLYQLLPPSIALALLVFLSIFSTALAILQDARVLSVIGISGGFLAPVLTSTGSGSHVVLFSYYALLNAGIFFTAWHKSWRELNLLGFVFTFGVGAVWGVQNYHPDMFATTEPFLVLFFLYYVLIGLLFAKNQPIKDKGYIDGTMVFGTPIVCFALQAGLTKPYEYGIAWSALVMGGLYASLAWYIFKNGSAAMRTLIESFLATGVIFGTIAIPLALDGRWTSAAWALEGAAIIWVGLRQERWMARVFGLVLQLLAGFAFFSVTGGPAANVAVVNGFYLGCVAVSLAGFFSSYCLFYYQDKIPATRQESLLALGWALLWWFAAGIHEIDIFVGHHYQLAATLAFWAASCAIMFFGATKLRWQSLKQVYKSLLPIMLLAAAYSFIKFASHPSIYGGYAAWPLAFIILYRLLYLDDDNFTDIMPALHIGSFLLFVALISWEFSWWVDSWVNGSGIWSLAVLGLIPAAFVFSISRSRDSLRWPIFDHTKIYLHDALAPVIIYLLLGSIAVNLTNKGNPWPLVYIPFLNPLDLTQLIVFLSIGFWTLTMIIRMQIAPFSLNNKSLIVTAAALVFLWLNAILIRTTHYWGGVDFNSHALMNSDLVQTSLSIFWTLSALAVMVVATKKKIRIVWIVGACLIGVVIAKLFTIDLANNGTMERIISFIGVGLICLVIGYFAPLPAQITEEPRGE